MKCLLGRFGLAGCLIVELGISPASAEIVPDSTLTQPSRVTRSQNRTVITAGTQQGENLFHSFREFSVRAGESAVFQPETSVRNVFARVTGRSPSRINGELEVLQSTANLFLLNPNGIIFGRNARLHVSGSLIATTADQINFANGAIFSSSRPQASPLLTVSAPVGLQFSHSSAPIINRSTAPLLDEAGNQIQDANAGGFPIFGLVGGSGQTLAFIGGDVTLTHESGIMTTGGQITIGSVLSAGQVTLEQSAQGWQFGYDGIRKFGKIRLQEDAVLNASGKPGGPIQLQGAQVSLHQSFAFSASADSVQPGGNLQVTSSDSIVVEQSSFLSSSTEGRGRAGNISLTTPQLTVRTGGQVSSLTTGSGRSGDIRVNAADSVTVEAIAPKTSLETPLSLLNTFSRGYGAAGDVSIITGQLQVHSGGQIGTTTGGSGNGGNLTVQAQEINLAGTAQKPNGEPLLSTEGLPNSAGLFAGTEANGNGGKLNVETQRLTVRDGAILQATTYGSGQAGNIRVQANSIQVSGRSVAGGFPARIAATSGGLPELNTSQSRRATGRGGSLNMTTNHLSIQNGGIVAVNSLNRQGQGAGTIRIQANRIELDYQGQLNAQTESGNQARIDLHNTKLLTLRRNSDISTTAGSRRDSGDAGNITIDADLILAAPSENSDIDANAQAGRGGNITIQSQGILGITPRSQQTIRSDITATSESSVDGEINISTASFDPTQGIVTLPDTVTDASQLIAQGCRAESQAAMSNGNQSAFVITGRGGLPPNPTDLQSGSTVMPHWVTVTPETSRPDHAEQSTPSHDRASTTSAITEAQGWVVTASGKVALVAQSPTLTPDADHWNLPTCLSQSRMP